MTEVDKKLIDYISKFYFDTGFYPNYEEIAEGMGWNSKSTVAIHVQRLEKEGIIIRKEYCSSQYKLKDINIVEIAQELAEYKNIGYTPKELAQLKELRTPKKPTLEGDGYDDEGFIAYDTWYCPNCNKNYELDYEEYDYCPNCGQCIDWSEEE